mmetsp:Transcript_15076/g.19940  ORF Transcript_15076/g.19940 Transcript_15076/m.19940 type:complete len:449 (+) Transcript_15076:12-1358(+)
MKPPSRVISHMSTLDREILNIAVPSLLALSLDPVLTMVDTGFVGRVAENSAEGLAAMGIASSVLNLVYPTTNFFTNAATPLVTKSQDIKLAGRICTLALVFGILLGVVIEISAPIVVTMAGGGPAAIAFTRYRALSAPAVVSSNALNGCLRGFGDARAALDAALLSAVINFTLDIFLVPQLGANGAAIATATAEFAGAALLLKRLFELTANIVVVQEEESSLKPFIGSAALTLSRSLALQFFLAGTTRFVATAGPQALAANHILKSVYSLLSFATDALAVAAQRLVATATNPKQVASRIFAWGTLLGLFFALSLYLTAEPLVLLLDYKDQLVISLAVDQIKRILAPLQILSSIVFVADGVLQGATAFRVEASAMLFSVAIASLILFYAPDAHDSPSVTLDTAWQAVCVLQAARAATFSLWWLLSFSSSPPDANEDDQTKISLNNGESS